MAKTANYSQGGDAQAISRVANSFYGSFRNMFESHNWDVPGDKMMPSAPGLIVKEYGSIQRFEELHASGELMSPMEAIYTDPPNVWLTSAYGFQPEVWGYTGFTGEQTGPNWRRQKFIDESKPGVLVVIYGAGEAARDELGKVIGIFQCSHRTGNAEQFSSPVEWRKKQADPKRRHKWNDAVKAVRAWRVTPESRMDVRSFAPEATKNDAWQHIGSQGAHLTKPEAFNILKLDLQEVDVYGENQIFASASGTARQILAPSKAGPVSQSPYVVREAEGPKHLYILKLCGNADAFLGRSAEGRTIVKAGFSRSPQTRRDDYNRALPECAFEWKVLCSGALSGFEPYPTSDHAKAGERAMQKVLCTEPHGESLGGEFFLASQDLVEQAWRKGNETAKDFSK